MSKPMPTAQEAVTPIVLREPAANSSMKPSEAQRRYLSLGADQPGGKLPLFDRNGKAIDRKTVESCVERGWAEPWFANPTKPDWLVCRLTPAGCVVIGRNAAGQTGAS